MSLPKDSEARDNDLNEDWADSGKELDDDEDTSADSPDDDLD
jgi:hypothetical protein